LILANYFKKLGYKVIIQRPSTLLTYKELSSKILHLESFEFKNLNFLYPTSCMPHKNLIIIIKAFSDIKNKDKILNITIGKDQTKYFKEIDKLVSERNNIRLIGHLDHKFLLDFMNNIKPVIIFPSLIESWGLPLEEAKMLNLKILSINRNYAKETLKKYDNVEYVDNNLSSWIESISNVIS
jgi:glycosyltransferase involved in cell wall biosynthesis